MQYGCEHEHKVVDVYKLDQLKGLKITPFGFILYIEKACSAVSLDSFVDCLYCGSGILKFKYPYSIRTDGLDAALEMS